MVSFEEKAIMGILRIVAFFSERKAKEIMFF